jgi:ATP-dependent exoDNAse (exonuclease V) beta subunit
MIRIMKASAGSGKTYNLAKTYISLLLGNEDRYAYRHILAVTFTNKATEEMKSRIIKELHILATDPSSSDYHDDFIPSMVADDASMMQRAGSILKDILHDYSAFAVSTIDRFFQQTLKAFSREIGQFASYQVELDKKSLVAESVDRVLDSLTQDDTGLLSWLSSNILEQIEAGGRYSPDANLLNMALRLMTPQRQEELARAGIEEQIAYSQDTLEAIRKKCRPIIEGFREKVRNTAAAAMAVLRAAKVNAKDSNRGFMSILLKYEELGEHDYVDYPSDSFMEKAPNHEVWFATAKKDMLLLVCPDLVKPMNELHRLFREEYKVYATAYILDDQIYGLGVARELSEAFKEIMKEKNVLCIDDSNTILKGIIDNTEAPFIYEKIGVRFDHFLLDEFQDTSSVQWDNFRSLLRESESKGKENLIVGDVKQSIYRWRGSDWKLLDSVIPEEFPGFVPEVLDTNYRSLSNIVKFNNGYFKAAAELLDKINGGGNYMRSIYSDVGQKVSKEDKAPGNVSVTFCPKDDQIAKVLESIAEAREAGADLSEIAVLVRTNMIGQSVAAALIDNGIPVITDDSLKVKRSVTVRRLVSMLSLIDNPDDTVGGYLAESLDVAVPGGCNSLVDMAEALIRELKENDSEGVVDGEILHLQSFMDNLYEYVSSEGNNLRGFLKHWEEVDPSICSPSSGESVRVMTIHKSKGLDFPYVIIPFADKIGMFSADRRWCAPDLKGSPLEGVAEGVYDVTLSKSYVNTMFADHFNEEKLLQMVDNINSIYVAMTRAALGMHIIAEKPSDKWVGDLKKEGTEKWKPDFSNFAKVLYWFVATGKMAGVRRSGDETFVRFDLGEMVDFNAMRKTEKAEAMRFPMADGGQYPSYALNPEISEDGDVRERGRLKFSADSLDFFSEDGTAGVEASNRIRGVVLHDILAHVKVPGDLDAAVEGARIAGSLTTEQAQQAREMLSTRLSEAVLMGWFPEDASQVYLERDVIDTDGQVYRPDRVVVRDGRVIIIDYKFGDHYNKYERQMKRYADIWRRMGHTEVTAVLWYVQKGEYKVI